LNPKENEKKHPLKVKEEYLLINEPFEDKLLLKESTQGDSIIKITLGLVSSPKKLDAIVKKLVEASILAAVGTLSGGFGIAKVVLDVVKVPKEEMEPAIALAGQ